MKQKSIPQPERETPLRKSTARIQDLKAKRTERQKPRGGP